MECKFWVGQKVVCVDDAYPPEDRAAWGSPPDVGTVVTVTSIKIYHCALVGRRVPCISFIQNPRAELDYWRADRFRPATDITIFKEIVAKVKNRDLIPAGVIR